MIVGTGAQFDANAVADEITDLVFGEIADSKGTHIETALTALGALAGFSAQMAVREFFIKIGKVTEKSALVEVKTNDGQTFYFGDLINEAIAATQKGNFSIWGFVGGAAQKLGASAPDWQELFKHVAGTVGTADFGVPRLPKDHIPRTPPIELLDRLWQPIRNYLAASTTNPSSWPFTLGLAAQKAIIRATDIIDPGLAARIVMEAAVPMSKLDPARVKHAYFFENKVSRVPS